MLGAAGAAGGEARRARGGLRARPAAALDRFAERLEAVQGRLAALEDAENPFAEIAEQLTGLYGQKDAAVEAVLGAAGAAGGEARRARGRAGAGAAARRGRPARGVDGLRARLEALHWAQGEVAAGLAALRAAGARAARSPAVAEQLTRLYAQKDAGVAAVLARLAPLEARLAGSRPGPGTRTPRRPAPRPRRSPPS